MKKVTIFSHDNALKSIMKCEDECECICYDKHLDELEDEHGNFSSLSYLPKKNLTFLIDDDKLVIDDDNDIKFSNIPEAPLKIMEDVCKRSDLNYFHHSLYKVEEYKPFPTKKVAIGTGVVGLIGAITYWKLR